MSKRIVVGISGASGVIYGARLLEVLKDTDYETHVLSEGTIQDFEMYGFDFEMGCYDDVLYYYVYSAQGETYEEIEHP